MFKFEYFCEVDKAFHMIFLAFSDNVINVDKKEARRVIWVEEDCLKRDVLKNPEKYTTMFFIGMKKFFNL